MKSAVFFLVGITLIAGFSLPKKRPRKDLAAVVARVAHQYVEREATLDSFLQAYPHYFYDSSWVVREKKYEELAYYFKRAANFFIYFEPDRYYRDVSGPFHFQKNNKKGFFSGIPDAWLFEGPIGNEPDSMLLKEFSRDDSLSQTDFIRQATATYRKLFAQYVNARHFETMSATVLFDALRLEIFRISTIDLANSDFIIEEAALPSLNGSLDSWLTFTGALVEALPTSENGLRAQWTTLRSGIKSYLADNKNYGSFDRMHFLRDYLIPVSRFLNHLQLALQVPFLSHQRATRSDALDIYNKDVFNADYFAPNKGGYYSRAKAELGELLFFDPILSGNNKRACASCHKPALGFTDARPKSVSFSLQTLPRNSPTVINSGLQKNEFWDLRASSLEDQLDSVINNKEELHSSFAALVDRLNSSPEYVRLFHDAFPETRRTGINRDAIKNAIAVYERTLIGLNSRFDQYVQGEPSALTLQEVNGFNLFMGKAKCGVCHMAPLFNGSLPPFYDFSDHHSLGIPIRDTMDKYVVDPDLGLMKVNGDSFSRFSFKVPTLRNIALTAPYMHNGVYKTLEQVVDFYDKAAGNQFSKDMRSDMTGLPFFTILPIALHLTDVEKKDLVAFLNALTDSSAASSVPHRLPAIRSGYAGLNNRTVGGDY
ncbi:MAG: cytochrome c peroxidase [Bacteroidota bacterium]|nr:cytochrome c peroxidase [Bacteroidota bacterium]